MASNNIFTTVGIFTVINKKYEYEYASERFLSLRKLDSTDLNSLSLRDVWGEEVFEKEIKPNIDKAFEGKTFTLTRWFKFSPIYKRYYNVQYVPLFDSTGKVNKVAVITQDLTRQKTETRKLKKELYTDVMTKAYNKKLLVKDLNTMLKSSEPFSFVFLDLDNFKYVNDTFGHSEGDKALCMIARLIRREFRVSDKLYRYGGDEFCLIYSGGKKDKLEDRLKEFLKILKKEDFNKKMKLGMSIGVAHVEFNFKQTPHDLISVTDTLMYRSKNAGKNRVSAVSV